MKGSELSRLHTASTMSIDLFDDTMSAREKKKLMSILSRVGPQPMESAADAAAPKSKKGKKATSHPEIEGEYHIIEEILDKRMFEGEAIYLCRWEGHDATYDSWEPVHHIYCSDMIDDFEKEFQEALPIATKYAQTAKAALSTVKMPHQSRSPKKMSLDSGGGGGKRAATSGTDSGHAKRAKELIECYVCEKQYDKAHMTAMKSNKSSSIKDYYCAECAAST